ncbi:MAG: PD40 domain-containing protein [Bdellovibrionales bacterium]|nr:PD40 domain-containing protein [Bdellovibrionales bacterium]
MKIKVKLPRIAPYLPLLCAWWLGLSSPALSQYNDIIRVSVDSGGSQGNSGSSIGSVSADGSIVAFASNASNLVDDDSNGLSDVFLYNRNTEAVLLISKNSSGASGNGASNEPFVSPDGAYVAFTSEASNLIDSDTNASSDIFVYKVADQTINRVSVTSSGGQSNGASYNPAISYDGQFVVFASEATNLTSVSDTNSSSDVFIHDRDAITTTLVSRIGNGSIGNGASIQPSVSSDGRYVAFSSFASNLVSNDTNAGSDVFLRDTTSSLTSRISLKSNGLEAQGGSSSPKITSDGSLVIFQSTAENIVDQDDNQTVDIFLFDRSDSSVEQISQNLTGLSPNAASYSPSISDDGQHIAFISEASDIVNSDTNNASDVFVYNRDDTTTSRVSLSSSGAQVDGASSSSAIAANSQYVVFTSVATNLIRGDSNQNPDIFLINIECLVDLGSTPTTDTDGDGTFNCDEDCGADPAKVEGGVCGCGVADIDTDGDGSLDCQDQCDSNPNKTERGACGCEESDTDSNGNGVADCLDPTETTVPRKALLVRKKAGKVVVRFPGAFTAVSYHYQFKRGGRIIRSGRTKRIITRLAHLSRGRYRFRYYMTLADVSTQNSKWTTIRVK